MWLKVTDWILSHDLVWPVARFRSTMRGGVLVGSVESPDASSEGSGGSEARLPRGAGIESTSYTIHRESRLNCPSCALSISTSRPFSRSWSTRTGFSSAGRTLVY